MRPALVTRYLDIVNKGSTKQCVKGCRQPWNRIKSEINIPLAHNDYSAGRHQATEAVHQQAIRVMQWQETQMNWYFFRCIGSWRLESENI
jgi:hypothetical protein